MRKLIATGLAALTFAGSIAAASAADAQSRYRRHRHNDNTGAAVAAGIAGLAIGAAIASNNDRRYRYYDRYEYPRGRYYGGYYYGPRRYAYDHYGYAPRYRARYCTTRLVWDPYWGEYVERTRCRRR